MGVPSIGEPAGSISREGQSLGKRHRCALISYLPNPHKEVVIVFMRR
jgi:hypothetical protein